MECKQCHQQYDVNMNTCPYCGAPREVQAPVQPQSNAQQQQPFSQQQAQEQPYSGHQQYAQQQYQQQAPTYQKEKSRASGALVCGILSIVFAWGGILGIVLSIIAISLGASAKNALPHDQAGSAKAGMICGIVGLCITIIAIIGSALYRSMLPYYYY